MSLRRLKPIERYVAAVSVAGATIGTWVVARNAEAELRAASWVVGALALLVIVGELYPIRVPLRDDAEDVTLSTAFMFAVLLLSGPAMAITAQVVASVVSDVRARRMWWKTVFNAAQYALSVAGAAAVLIALDPGLRFGVSPFSLRLYIATLIAGLTSFVLNNLLVVVALSIAQRVSIVRQVRSNLGFHSATTMVLLAQGPLIALAASHSIAWVLLFAPGIFAVYRTAMISVAKEHLATHDSLTGLPNRLLFHERIARLIAEDDQLSLVVMLIDLDGFKEVNDTLGHHIGDSLLCQVGERLRDRLRDSVIVARLGGDEFAVVSAKHDRVEIAEFGNSVLAALREPFTLQDLPFHIEASVGAALYPEHATDIDTLLQRADVAMYTAKERGTGYEIYHPNHDRYSPRRLALLGELRSAIENDELVLHYQPIADLHTGSVTRVEALVRWNHPTHGLLQPDEFVPLAEPTGLMGPLTRHVLDLALAQCRAWHDRNLDVTVAVNVSARNLHNSELRDDVTTLLAKWSLPPTALELEITESIVMSDPRRATEILESLHVLGINTSLDDFGTGHSSLTYLKRLPVSQLKIDRSFIMNMATDDEDTAIVSSTIALAQSLGLTVVAEGVENETTWQQLHKLGCHFAQGYFLSRPLTADLLTHWLEHRNSQTLDDTESPPTKRTLTVASLPPERTREPAAS